ncbi:MAG: YhbY family RNA-binding protein [Gemmatimonadetes bacterium]|nr:YhbY family RNA-binding protein [Gemmatimonadota bacterium]
MTEMTGKERADLRSECNALKATVHVGAQGLSPTLTASLDDALRTHELVKVQLGKPVDMTAKKAAGELAGRVKAEVIQVIGKTCTLYRRNNELKRKHGAPPPWRA